MVVVYLTTAIGVPVYMHYCGGKLEKVSFLVEAPGCCEGEEPGDADECCDNENTVARYTPDFTVKKVVDSNFNIVNVDLFTLAPVLFDLNIEKVSRAASKHFIPPPDILNRDIIRTTFLRI